jgi:excisionase family DNA binding protein
MNQKDTTSLLTARDVAKLLHLNVNTVRRWSKNGMIPAYRVNPRGHMKFNKDDVTDFLNGHRSIQKHELPSS